MNAPTSDIHPDLRESESFGVGMGLLGVLGLAFGGGMGWLAVAGGKAVWSDIATGHASWDRDWLGGALTVIVFAALAVAIMAGSIFEIAVMVWLCLPDAAELAWAKQATIVEQGQSAREAWIRVVRASSGGGVGGGVPRIDLSIEVFATGGDSAASLYPGLVVRRVTVLESGRGERINLSDMSKSDDRLDNLWGRHPGIGLPEAIPGRRLGSRRRSAMIPARLKVDSAERPHVVIIEADDLRLWCSLRTTPEVTAPLA